MALRTLVEYAWPRNRPGAVPVSDVVEVSFLDHIAGDHADVARPDRRLDDRVAGSAGGEGFARRGGRVVGGGLHRGGEVGELVERRVDADQGELALHDGEVGTPDVGEDAP